MDLIKTVLFIAATISLCSNVYLSSYWYDHEYPHGEKGIWAKEIVFRKDAYGVFDYVTIGSESFQCRDFDVKSRVYEVLGGWRNFSYTVILDEGSSWSTERIVITDVREPSFHVSYHTYDAPFECSAGTYKQCVIDSFDIGGWLSSSP